MTARALVLSAETPSAVAVVRGLHAAGFDVTVLSESRLSPAAASWRCGAALRVGRWGSADVVSHVLDTNADVVVPVTEADLLRVAPVRISVERLAPVVAPPRAILDRVLDKVLTGRVARELGDPHVSSPDEIVIGHREKVGSTEENDFPLVVKPRRSRRLLADGTLWGDTARYCADIHDLREAHREFGEGEQDTLAQIPVYGTALLVSLLLDHDGELASVFVHRRIRQSRPEGGPSACAVSHAPDPALVAPAVALARALDVLGVPVQFEFVVDGGGVLVLLDVNPRPWGTLGLALDSGVNFYGDAARHALGAPLPARPGDYEVGVVRHYLPFEIRHALHVATGVPCVGYEGPWPRGGVLALARCGFLPTDALVFRPDDPLPALAGVAYHVHRLLRAH